MTEVWLCRWQGCGCRCSSTAWSMAPPTQSSPTTGLPRTRPARRQAASENPPSHCTPSSAPTGAQDADLLPAVFIAPSKSTSAHNVELHLGTGRPSKRYKGDLFVSGASFHFFQSKNVRTLTASLEGWTRMPSNLCIPLDLKASASHQRDQASNCGRADAGCC